MVSHIDTYGSPNTRSFAQKRVRTKISQTVRTKYVFYYCSYKAGEVNAVFTFNFHVIFLGVFMGNYRSCMLHEIF